MALNDTLEQLHAAQAQTLIDERRIRDLQAQVAVLEPMAQRLGQLHDLEQHAVVLCRHCGHSVTSLENLAGHLTEAATGHLAEYHRNPEPEHR